MALSEDRRRKADELLSERIEIKLGPRLKAGLERIAADKGQPVSELVRDALIGVVEPSASGAPVEEIPPMVPLEGA